MTTKRTQSDAADGTEEQAIATKRAQSTEVADRVAEFIAELHSEGCYHPAALVTGAHVQIAMLLAATCGGAEAANMLERAAERVRHMPSVAEWRLAAAQPAGTA